MNGDSIDVTSCCAGRDNLSQDLLVLRRRADWRDDIERACVSKMAPERAGPCSAAHNPDVARRTARQVTRSAQPDMGKPRRRPDLPSLQQRLDEHTGKDRA